MPYRKFRPLKQWEKMHTFVLKHSYWARQRAKYPVLKVPAWMKERGITVYDPNDPDFPRPQPPTPPDLRLEHPAFKKPTLQDHRWYKEDPVTYFNSSEPFSEGVSQALVLSNAVAQRRLPPSLLDTTDTPSWLRQAVDWWVGEALPAVQYEGQQKLPVYPRWPDKHEKAAALQEQLRRGVLQAHVNDPSLDALPVRHDDILFWYQHQRVFGTPEHRKYDIMLSDLYRRCMTLDGGARPQLQHMRHFRHSLVSAFRRTISGGEPPIYFEQHPTLCCVQSAPLPAVATTDEVQATAGRPLPSDIRPLTPYVDLIKRHHIYNTEPYYPRIHTDDADRGGGYSLLTTDPVLPPMYLHTLFTSLNVTDLEHQKYPWSDTALTANAIVNCYAGALAVAQKRFPEVQSGALPKPVVVQLVQMSRGALELVVFQLNTLDTDNPSGVKNMCWFEPAADYFHYTTYWLQTPPDSIRPNLATFAKVHALLSHADPTLKTTPPPV